MIKDIIKDCGLECVGQEAEDVWEWLKDGWLSQHKFDSLVSSSELKPIRVFSMNDDSLTPPMSGQNHLFALQVMQANNLVEGKEEDGVIYYRRKGE